MAGTRLWIQTIVVFQLIALIGLAIHVGICGTDDILCRTVWYHWLFPPIIIEPPPIEESLHPSIGTSSLSPPPRLSIITDQSHVDAWKLALRSLDQQQHASPQHQKYATSTIPSIQWRTTPLSPSSASSTTISTTTNSPLSEVCKHPNIAMATALIALRKKSQQQNDISLGSTESTTFIDNKHLLDPQVWLCPPKNIKEETGHDNKAKTTGSSSSTDESDEIVAKIILHQGRMIVYPFLPPTESTDASSESTTLHTQQQQQQQQQKQQELLVYQWILSNVLGISTTTTKETKRSSSSSPITRTTTSTGRHGYPFNQFTIRLVVEEGTSQVSKWTAAISKWKRTHLDDPPSTMHKSTAATSSFFPHVEHVHSELQFLNSTASRSYHTLLQQYKLQQEQLQQEIAQERERKRLEWEKRQQQRQYERQQRRQERLNQIREAEQQRTKRQQAQREIQELEKTMEGDAQEASLVDDNGNEESSTSNREPSVASDLIQDNEEEVDVTMDDEEDDEDDYYDDDGDDDFSSITLPPLEPLSSSQLEWILRDELQYLYQKQPNINHPHVILYIPKSPLPVNNRDMQTDQSSASLSWFVGCGQGKQNTSKYTKHLKENVPMAMISLIGKQPSTSIGSDKNEYEQIIDQILNTGVPSLLSMAMGVPSSLLQVPSSSRSMFDSTQIQKQIVVDQELSDGSFPIWFWNKFWEEEVLSKSIRFNAQEQIQITYNLLQQDIRPWVEQIDSKNSIPNLLELYHDAIHSINQAVRLMRLPNGWSIRPSSNHDKSDKTNDTATTTIAHQEWNPELEYEYWKHVILTSQVIQDKLNLPTDDSFPIEQYLAIFAPLLVPLMLPFLASWIREWKRYQAKQKKKQQSGMDETRPQ